MEKLIVFLLFLLIPTFAAFLTFPLWFWKKVHNDCIIGIGTVLFLIPFVIAWMQFDSDKKFFAVLFIILLFFANVLGYRLFIKTIRINRCPQCHRFNLQVVSHDKERTTKTTRTYYTDGSHRDASTTYTSRDFYELYCPDCGYTYEWNH